MSIHMNGRAYDYNLGRFLSVDPFIQAPGNSQSMNPYSYIMNNPLAGTDPSGYIAKCESDAAATCNKKKNKPVVKVRRDSRSACKTGNTCGGHGSYIITVKGKDDNGKEFKFSFNSKAKPQNAEEVNTIETFARDFSILSKRVYSDQTELPDGWTGSTLDIPEEMIYDYDSGFHAGIYYNESLDLTLVAYSGTDELKEFISPNAEQARGLTKTKQYSMAVALAQRVSRLVGEDSGLMFTGHSLGGGLASISALVTMRHAITFNSAGINESTAKLFGTTTAYADDLIAAYYVRFEILSVAQDVSLLPNAIGRRIAISPDLSISTFICPGCWSADLHRIDNVIKYLGKSND